MRKSAECWPNSISLRTRPLASSPRHIRWVVEIPTGCFRFMHHVKHLAFFWCKSENVMVILVHHLLSTALLRYHIISLPMDLVSMCVACTQSVGLKFKGLQGKCPAVLLLHSALSACFCHCMPSSLTWLSLTGEDVKYVQKSVEQLAV